MVGLKLLPGMVFSLLVFVSTGAFAESSLSLEGGGTVSVEDGIIILTLPEKYRFEFDDSSVEQSGTSDSLGDFLGRYQGTFNLEIHGHTDEVGTDEYNMKLGMRRSESVSSQLVGRGVSSEHLTATSYGSVIPLFSDVEDRRVELMIKYVD